MTNPPDLQNHRLTPVHARADWEFDVSRILFQTILMGGFLAMVWWSSPPDQQLSDAPAIHRATNGGKAESSVVDPSGVIEPIHFVQTNETLSHAPSAIADSDFSHDNNAMFHGHGDQVCASGCALSRHPTERLTRRRYLQLIEELAALDTRANASSLSQSLPFETLLYFGRQSSNMMTHYGSGDLSNDIVALLKKELQRTHAYVSIRVSDVDGDVRSWLKPTRVPLDRRHVFTMQTERLQPLVTSGTVKRVGKNHVWTRL